MKKSDHTKAARSLSNDYNFRVQPKAPIGFLPGVGILSLSIALSGCISDPDIKAAAKYSKTWEPKVKAISPLLTKNLNDSCARIVMYVPAQQQDNLTIIPDSSSGTFGIKRDDVVNKLCRNEQVKETEKAFKDAHKFILDYLASIGKLAGVDTGPVAKAAGDAVTNVGKLPGLSSPEQQDTVKAASGLVQILTRLFVQGYQKTELRNAIQNANEPLYVISKNFSKSIDNYYIKGVLQTEFSTMARFYSDPLRATSLLAERNTDSLLAEAMVPYMRTNLITSFNRDRERFAEKQDFAKSYVTLLKAVSCDHSKLDAVFSDKDVKTAVAANDLCPPQKPEELAFYDSLRQMSQDDAARKLASRSLIKYTKILSRLQ